MESFEALNEGVVTLWGEINGGGERYIITEEFGDLTNNDMHVIDAIGIGEPKNMSAIARELSVTMGTLTIAMNSLVKKGYVIRQRGKADRRVVYISLSEKGTKAYHRHKDFHEQMVKSAVKELTEEELKALIKALRSLRSWMKSFEEH